MLEMMGRELLKDFKKKFISFSVIALFPLLLTVVSGSLAEAFQARLLPATIKQGDAFVIRVSGVLGKARPSASIEGEQILFSSCGKNRFIAIGAIDIKSKPGIYRVPLRIGRRKTMLRLHVSEGRFKTVHLSLPEEKVSPAPEDLERIKREADLLNSIWQISSEKLWQGRFILPLPTPLSTPFGTERILNDETVSLHRGIDMEGTAGEEIHASNRGRVILTEELFFGGNTVIIDHGRGIFTIYMHLSGFSVTPGDLVSKDDVIGAVGSTGRSTGPHLHFGVKVLGLNANPVSLTGLSLE